MKMRRKMGWLGAAAKNRLHRHHILPPEGKELFHPDFKAWWQGLKVSPLEQVRIQSDLATLEFAQGQKLTLEAEMGKAVAGDERIPLLVQIPGVALLTAVTILAAMGRWRVSRMPSTWSGMPDWARACMPAASATPPAGSPRAAERI